MVTLLEGFAALRDRIDRYEGVGRAVRSFTEEIEQELNAALARPSSGERLRAIKAQESRLKARIAATQELGTVGAEEHRDLAELYRASAEAAKATLAALLDEDGRASE